MISRTLRFTGCFCFCLVNESFAQAPDSSDPVAAAPSGAGTAPVADAQTDKVAADTLFKQGREFMDAERFEDACRAFSDSNRLDFAVGTLMNLALCYKRWGRTASAWSSYRSAAAAARDRGQLERQEVALEEARQLEESLSYVVLHVEHAPAELSLVVDGTTILPSLWGTRLPIDPGAHNIVAQAPGYVEQAFEIEITEKDTEWSLPALEPLPEEEPAVEPVPPKAPVAEASPPHSTIQNRPSTGSQQSVWLPVSAGVTAAFAVSVGVTGGLYLSERSHLAELNSDRTTSVRSRRESRESAERLNLINLVLLGGTVASAGLTTVLWLNQESDTEVTGRLAPELTAISDGAKLRGLSVGLRGEL